MAENVIGQLKHIISEELDLNLKLEEIDEAASLFEAGLGLDSIVVIEFITLIEEYFGFEFSDSELNVEAFKNLKVLAEFISTKVNNGGSETTGTN